MALPSIMCKKKCLVWISRFPYCLCACALNDGRFSFRVDFILSWVCFPVIILWLMAVSSEAIVVGFRLERLSITKPTRYPDRALVVRGSGLLRPFVPGRVVSPSQGSEKSPCRLLCEKGRRHGTFCLVLYSSWHIPWYMRRNIEDTILFFLTWKKVFKWNLMDLSLFPEKVIA